MHKRIVPDTSVLIEGLVTEWMKEGKISPDEIIIHEAVLAELEHQANSNKTTGFLGLEELKRLKGIENIKIRYAGQRPSYGHIKHAYLGEIDALIRNLAYEEDAALFTVDRVQAETAQAKGIPVILVHLKTMPSKIRLESFFDETTMSVHLKDGLVPVAKKGKPGAWEFVEVAKSSLTQDEVKKIAEEIIEEAGVRKDGFIEMERPGSTIVQLGRFRIVITKPPFSDRLEITAVRPVARLSLGDYHLSEALKKRISEQAEGILVAGSPGMGKSTFVQGLADYYASQKKIVKTVEAPRDLVLSDEVTQYAISHGSSQEVHDILLLSRPDYTLYDEMRDTADFKLFADLRLAGIGLVGVVHATKPVDAIQRFLGRIELGVIPQIIDTVIFIKNGVVEKVLRLEMMVKVPSGMQEADLARPVVVVADFETNTPEYELYSYGEETVVIPVTPSKRSSVQKLAEEEIRRRFMRIVDRTEVEMLSDNRCAVYVQETDIPGVIGRQGRNIESLEKELGVSIDVRALKKNREASGESAKFEASQSKNALKFYPIDDLRNRDVDIFVNGEFVVTTRVGKKNVISLNKNNAMGRTLFNALQRKERIDVIAR